MRLPPSLRPIEPFVARDIDLRRWRAGFPDATAIADVRPRQATTVLGVVQRIRLAPGQGIEVTVEDGSGRLTGAWTGQTRLPGIELGGGLRLTGTVATAPGELPRMVNPSWQLVSEPYS
jgi:hypothetical protein